MVSFYKAEIESVASARAAESFSSDLDAAYQSIIDDMDDEESDLPTDLADLVALVESSASSDTIHTADEITRMAHWFIYRKAHAELGFFIDELELES